MQDIQCKTYTNFPCSFQFQGSDPEKIKQKLRTHLEHEHVTTTQGKKSMTPPAIREIMQKLDNDLLGKGKMTSHRLV